MPVIGLFKDILTSSDKVDKKNNGRRLGPTFDCVVFNDGEISRVRIDTSEVGDVASPKLIWEYSKTYEYVMLSADLIIAINVGDDGKILVIMSVCLKHNTYMVEVSSANFPDEPERNVVSPAQVIASCFHDMCLSSTETGTAITGAMIQVMQNKSLKVHVMNVSYVDHLHYSASGQVIDMMPELINKYGPVRIISAGNESLAFTTISTPNVNSNALIGVSAYVSPEIMVAEDFLHSKLPGTSPTWTSRGPCRTGEPGVTECAGAAFTSVPQFLLCNSMLMNGTSMASPHVCGVVAVLFSGIVQQKVPYTLHSPKRAPDKAAQPIENQDEHKQGHGSMKVEKNLECLVAYHDQPDYKFCIIMCWTNVLYKTYC